MHTTMITRHISATAGTAKRFVMVRTTSELFFPASQGETFTAKLPTADDAFVHRRRQRWRIAMENRAGE